MKNVHLDKWLFRMTENHLDKKYIWILIRTVFKILNIEYLNVYYTVIMYHITTCHKITNHTFWESITIDIWKYYAGCFVGAVSQDKTDS